MKAITATILLVALLVMAKAQKRYQISDLGALPGGNASRATAINDRGQVVGESQVIGTQFSGNHAFLYSNGLMTDLGVLGGIGNRFSFAEGINNHGQVVGNSDTTPDDALFIHPFLWTAGHLIDLGTFGGIQPGSANGINDRGIVVGDSPIKTGDLRAFIYDGVLRDLGLGNGSIATSINNFNQVVGTVSGTSNRIFLWHHGQVRFLPTLGGTNSFAPAINDFGFIIGTSDLAGDAVFHAFIYAFGRIFDLGPNPANSSIAHGQNRFAQVVGSYSQDATTEHAFLWEPGAKMRDLNDLIDPGSGWILTTAAGINDRGQIAGSGFHKDLEHAFLLNPCY